MVSKIHYPQLLEKLPPEAKTIFNIFGDKIRLVGGSVRDLLLEKNVSDFDFATEFLPKDVIRILEENNIIALPTGLKHGTVSALINHKTYEITTLRKDVETFGRHAKVEFVDDYLLDAKRRDFTINALYLDNKGLVYDYFNGISDIKNKEVKFIGDADARIKEDYLRILRFFRFSCNYAKSLDNKGLEACAANKENLKSLAKERITNEIIKIFSTKKNDNLIMVLQALQNEKIFFSHLEIANLQKLLQLEEALKIEVSSLLKFFVALNNKEINWLEIFVNFAFSNQQKDYFIFFSKANFHEKILNELLAFFDKNLVLDLYLISLVYDSKQMQTALIKKNFHFIKEFTLPKFPLNGNDLMEIGFENKMIGENLKRAKIFWANGGFRASRAELIDYINQAYHT